jgi:hypothetical protein
MNRLRLWSAGALLCLGCVDTRAVPAQATQEPSAADSRYPGARSEITTGWNLVRTTPQRLEA